jgi:hypothetical protein
MRDYGNIPGISWNHDFQAAHKARAQILRSEPVIIDMPDTLRFDLCPTDFSCRVDSQSGILYNCDGGGVLQWLAELNMQPRLRLLEEAVRVTSATVDIDAATHRLIIHH